MELLYFRSNHVQLRIELKFHNCTCCNGLHRIYNLSKNFDIQYRNSLRYENCLMSRTCELTAQLSDWPTIVRRLWTQTSFQRQQFLQVIPCAFAFFQPLPQRLRCKLLGSLSRNKNGGMILPVSVFMLVIFYILCT